MVFESGGGGWPVGGWDQILADIAKVAPVMAYDRAGYGRSEPDGQPPTPRHNAEKLHRLLAPLGGDVILAMERHDPSPSSRRGPLRHNETSQILRPNSR